jgi:hypothetical protein
MNLGTIKFSPSICGDKVPVFFTINQKHIMCTELT